MTNKTAQITISPEHQNTWDVKCDVCKRMSRPIRLLIIGVTAFELCPPCYGELKTAIVS